MPSRETAFLPSPLKTAAVYTRSSTEFKGVKRRQMHLVSDQKFYLSVYKQIQDTRGANTQKIHNQNKQEDKVSCIIGILRLILLLLNLTETYHCVLKEYSRASIFKREKFRYPFNQKENQPQLVPNAFLNKKSTLSSLMIKSNYMVVMCNVAYASDK